VSEIATHEALALGYAVLGLLLLWVIYGVGGGRWNPWLLAEGADGRASLSKFQLLLWTAAAMGAVIAVVADQALRQGARATEITSLPENLLLSMGFSVITATAAKAITVSYVTSGQVRKDVRTNRPLVFADLVNDDAGFPDLGKTQMLSWTLIALGVFALRLHEQLSGADLPQVPNIDAPLMLLMGLGQGAYLGQKLTTTTRPRLTGLSPVSGGGGTVITIFGFGFGAQDNNAVTIDGMPVQTITTWEDARIVFALPAAHPGGRAWAAGQQIAVGVLVVGQPGVNALPFTLT